MGLVITDELNEGEKKAKKKLTKRQQIILKEADCAGGVIYRYKIKGMKHPVIRYGQGKTSYPPKGKSDAKIYETYNKELEALLEKGMLFCRKANIYMLSWSGWRIARVLNNEE